MYCPRDRAFLTPDHRDAGVIHSCNDCSGLLIPSNQIPRLPESDESWSKVLKLPKSETNCPSCHTKTRLLNYAGVEIDICPACHSVWLDGGESEKILRHRKNSDGTWLSVIDPITPFISEGSAVGTAGACGATADAAAAAADTTSILDGVGIIFDFLGDVVGGFLGGLF